jgi:hypothetical protein
MDYVLHFGLTLYLIICVFNLYNSLFKRYNLSSYRSESIYDRWVDLELTRKYGVISAENNRNLIKVKTNQT